MTKQKKHVLTLNDEEHGVVVNALFDMHNDLIKAERPTETVDEVLEKAMSAPERKIKCRCDEAR